MLKPQHHLAQLLGHHTKPFPSHHRRTRLLMAAHLAGLSRIQTTNELDDETARRLLDTYWPDSEQGVPTVPELTILAEALHPIAVRDYPLPPELTPEERRENRRRKSARQRARPKTKQPGKQVHQETEQEVEARQAKKAELLERWSKWK